MSKLHFFFPLFLLFLLYSAFDVTQLANEFNNLAVGVVKRLWLSPSSMCMCLLGHKWLTCLLGEVFNFSLSLQKNVNGNCAGGEDFPAS